MATKFTNSELATYVKISPFKNYPRNQPITKITIHHMAGVGSVESFGTIVTTPGRNMSATYAIGNDGRIGRYLDESDRPWTSSSSWNDHQAITIEVSNSKLNGDWPVSAKAYESLIKLCVDICKRNNIKELTYTGDKNGSLTFHRFFAATGCLPIETTEVLTESGWVLLRDVQIGDRIAVASPKNLGITFRPVENLVPVHRADVFTVNGMTVTDDHRVLFNDGVKTGYQLKEFNEIRDNAYMIPSAGNISRLGLNMTSSEMVFLLETQRVGTINPEKKTIEFSYIMEQQVGYFNTLVKNIRFEFERTRDDLGQVRFTVTDRRAWDLCQEYLSGRDFNWKWLDMSSTQFSYFVYKVTSNEDGSWRRKYTSDSLMNIDIFQAICALNDRGTKYDSKTRTVYVSEPYRHIESTDAVHVDKDVDVSCVTVNTGCFLIRQNGYTTITGNCPGEYLYSRAQEICKLVNAQLKPGSISTSEKSEPVVTPVGIVAGALVSIKSGATYYTGNAMPKWVINDRWYISSVSGDRAVIGKNESGTSNIMSPVNTKYLTVIQNAGAPIKQTFEPYVVSLPVGTTIYSINGTKVSSIGVIQLTSKYTIVQETVISGNKYGKLKSGAGWVVCASSTNPVDSTIHVGDMVEVVKNETYDGKTFKVYEKSYKVLQVNGDRVVISSDGKNVTAAVKAANLRKL